MIMGQTVPPMYYMLLCDSHYYPRLFFCTLIAVCCMWAFFLTIRTLGKGNILWISLSFVATGFSSAPGLIYIYFFVSEKELHNFPGLFWFYSVQALIYFIGIGFYVTRFPEKLFPRTFDIIGSSHQIFHSFIVVACIMSLYSSLRAFHERQLYGC